MSSILVYTVHKAASMFLHKLTGSVASELGLPYCSINHWRHQRRIKAQGWNPVIVSANKPTAYGPIRAGEARPYFPPNIESYRIILQLRDPRDVLTSLFYSHVFSHSRKPGVFSPSDEKRIKWAEDGVDAYVELRMTEFKDRYSELCDTLLHLDNCTLVTYETMVSDYDLWLSRYLNAFRSTLAEREQSARFGRTPLTYDTLHLRMYNKYKDEFDVSGEDKYKHKRQVAPGDHHRKLKPETILELNHEFGDLLHILGYEQEISTSSNV